MKHVFMICSAWFLICNIALINASTSHSPVSYAVTDGESWNYQQFKKVVKQSGRQFKVSSETFALIQENKIRALNSIQAYLNSKFKKTDPAVIEAFKEVPREYFHFNYEHKYDFAAKAYEEKAKPWGIGYGSALSDYLGQAYMTQLAKPKPEDTVLEIGTGSGFQIAILSRIARKAYSIEIIEPLGESVKKIFPPLHYDNIETRVGDGYYGWPDVNKGFDIIMITCSAQFVPPPLFKQLKPGGRLIIPIGQPFKRGQALYVFTKDEQGRVRSRKDMGVYFIPMLGELEKQASTEPDTQKKKGN